MLQKGTIEELLIQQLKGKEITVTGEMFQLVTTVGHTNTTTHKGIFERMNLKHRGNNVFYSIAFADGSIVQELKTNSIISFEEQEAPATVQEKIVYVDKIVEVPVEPEKIEVEKIIHETVEVYKEPFRFISLGNITEISNNENTQTVMFPFLFTDEDTNKLSIKITGLQENVNMAGNPVLVDKGNGFYTFEFKFNNIIEQPFEISISYKKQTISTKAVLIKN